MSGADRYFFLSFGLLSAAPFAPFFGFLVSFFCALLPLAMIPSWRSSSMGDLHLLAILHELGLAAPAPERSP